MGSLAFANYMRSVIPPGVSKAETIVPVMAAIPRRSARMVSWGFFPFYFQLFSLWARIEIDMD